VDPGKLLAETPELLGHLTEATWEDGGERELSTLTVFRQDGSWKVWLNDRACDRFSCVSGDTIEQALASLEDRLQTGTMDWRTSKDRKGGTRR
jgi:hypothetical protein